MVNVPWRNVLSVINGVCVLNCTAELLLHGFGLGENAGREVTDIYLKNMRPFLK